MKVKIPQVQLFQRHLSKEEIKLLKKQLLDLGCEELREVLTKVLNKKIQELQVPVDSKHPNWAIERAMRDGRVDELRWFVQILNPEVINE